MWGCFRPDIVDNPLARTEVDPAPGLDVEDALHVIDGEAVASLSGRTFETINPATGKRLAKAAFGEPEDVERAVDAASAAYDDGRWRNLPPAERARRLRRIANGIRDNAARLAQLETADTGKPLSASMGDVEAAADLLDYASTICQNVSGKVHADECGFFTHSRREPYGVVGAIAPWNFPFLNAVWKTAAPLAVGNSIVLKMAEQTPLTTSVYAQLCIDAGIPAGVLNVVQGDGPTTGAALVRNPRVPKITFTGSTEVGAEILRATASQIKSCHLELGGKTANIVFEDADLERALTGSLFTSFFNSGQICTAGSRLLVQESIASEFVDALCGRARTLRVGDPLAEGTDLGPLISAEQLERVDGYVRSGNEAGADLVLGGGRPSEAPTGGYFYEPSVLTNVAPKMSIAREEIFGPVLAVIEFSTEAEAIMLANGVLYGLAATVWTNRLDRALRMIEALEAGIVWTNCTHHLVWNAPYEGHKISGLGEDMGLEAAETFTKLKVSYINYAAPGISWGENGA